MIVTIEGFDMPGLTGPQVCRELARSAQEAGRPVSVPEAIIAVESLHRHLPPVEGRVEDPIAALLRSAGCVREG